MVRGILFGVMLMCATLGAVEAQARSSSGAQQSEMRGVEAWLGDLARWSQDYQSLQTRQADVINDVLAGFEQAIQYQEAGDVRGGSAWAAEWRVGVDGDLEALRTYLAGLAPSPPPAPDGMTPQVQAAIADMRNREGPSPRSRR